MPASAYIPFGGDEVDETTFEAARIVVLPLCYEKGPSYGAGSREGPYHILRASEQLEGLDEETLVDWSRLPIHTMAPFVPSDDPDAAVEQIRHQAARVLAAKKFLLSLGGDHAVTIGLAAAAADMFPQDLGVLQIDAHLDLRETWNGSRFNHACVMRRIISDLNLPVVPVGIRSFSAGEARFVRENQLQPVFAHAIDPLDSSWIDEAVSRLPRHVYLSVDLDGLDPSVIPGTGTPEPGGLSYRQLTGLIRAVGARRTVVAADITELVKIEGTRVSEFTAAKIATKIFVNCIR